MNDAGGERSRNGGSGMEYGSERKIGQDDFRTYVRRLCSLMGFSLCFLFVMLQLLSLLLYALSYYLASHGVMGAGGELFKILNSDWFDVAGSSLLSYAIAIPLMVRLLSAAPEVRVEPKKMRFGKFVMFFFLIMGGGYLFNMLGSFINLILAAVSKRDVYDMMPVSSLMDQMDLFTAVYVGIIGPVIEEYIFRKQLLNRLRPLGEKAAIIFSAVMFGLMHGNLSQFLYATAIGTIFGYVAVKTGRIFYNCLLHIMVNSYTTFFVLGVLRSQAGGIFFYVGLMFVSLFLLGSIIAAIVIFFVNRKKTRLKTGNLPPGIEYRDFSSAMYCNPGVIVFMFICCSMMLYYAFVI